MIIGKRGLSPVIASVFMIMLVLFMASFVFSWARGFVEDKGDAVVSDFSASQLCDSVNFDVVIVDNEGDNYDFEAVNRGNVNISSLKFRIYPGGDSNVVDSNVGILAGGAITGNVVLSGDIDRVEALSVLDGKLAGRSSDIVCVRAPVNLEGV